MCTSRVCSLGDMVAGRSHRTGGSIVITAKLGKEVVVRVRKNPNTLAHITKLLADKGFDLSAATAWVEGGDTIIRFVTADHVRAVDALRERELVPIEREVIEIEVPHRPGMLRRITEILALEGVELDHFYATAGESDRKCVVVLATRNNERALLALRAGV